MPVLWRGIRRNAQADGKEEEIIPRRRDWRRRPHDRRLDLLHSLRGHRLHLWNRVRDPGQAEGAQDGGRGPGSTVLLGGRPCDSRICTETTVVPMSTITTCECGAKVRLPEASETRALRCPVCKAGIALSIDARVLSSTRLGAGQAGATCPLCQSEIRENDMAVTCPKCDQVHHRERWAEVGG